MKNFSDSYKEAGVDVTAGYKAVELMKQHVARTNIPGVVSNIGSFWRTVSTGFYRYESAYPCVGNRWSKVQNYVWLF